MKGFWISIAIIAVIGVIISFRLLKPEQTDTIPEEVDAVAKPVEIVKAKRDEIRSELKLSGSIEAKSRVNIIPKVSGRIISISVSEGDRVEQGDTLAVVEHEELDLAVQQAQATLEAAEIGYSQTKQLAKVRVLSQLAQAKAHFDAAEASLQQVKELAEIRTVTQIEQAKAGLKSLEANLEKIKTGARDEDRRQAKAGLNQAEANLTNAKNNYSRSEHLFKNGAISQQSLDNSKNTVRCCKRSI